MSPTSNPLPSSQSLPPSQSLATTNQSEDVKGCDASIISQESDTYSETYFDALYSDNSDPWQYQTRWYEKRKRDICLAVLPQAHYGKAIELGCGNGVFSELLAKRCQALLSIDGNSNAVQLAKQRLQGVSHVKVVQGVIPNALLDIKETLLHAYPLSDESTQNTSSDKCQSTPTPPFDLIVISEILYYLSADNIDTVIAWIRQHLAQGGTLLCCHWRYAIDGFNLNGDMVHQRLQQAFNTISNNDDLNKDGKQVAFTHQTQIKESDFLLDVWINASSSVAMQENLV